MHFYFLSNLFRINLSIISVWTNDAIQTCQWKITFVIDRERSDDQKLQDAEGRGDDGRDVNEDEEGAASIQKLEVLEVAKFWSVAEFETEDEKLEKAFSERFQSNDVAFETMLAFDPITWNDSLIWRHQLII